MRGLMYNPRGFDSAGRAHYHILEVRIGGVDYEKFDKTLRRGGADNFARGRRIRGRVCKA